MTGLAFRDEIYDRRKIIIQDVTDAASRISITIFTIQLALIISCQICKSLCIIRSF